MLEPGMVLFDKYRVDHVLGQGGMAVVVKAMHLHLGEPVAIKVLLPEVANRPTVIHRFLREAQAAVRLKGEHVTRVIDVGTLPWGPPYMVMEFLEGGDLAAMLRHHKVLAPTQTVDLILQACEALAEAHAAGIIHRDIKPANLFLTHRPDGSPLLKVLDFGISKIVDDVVSSLTQDAVLGTPSYMSPEQLRGSHDVDARTDIWSLGVVMYRMLSGYQPFRGESLSALAIQAATEPTPVLDVALPPGLDAVVYRCLAKELDHRYASIAELAHALAPFAGDLRAATIVVERTQAIARWTPPPPIACPAPPAAPIAPSHPTTLGSSAGSMVSPIVSPIAPPSRGRLGWMLGAGLIAGCAGVVVIAMSLGGGDASPSAAGATAPDEQPATVMPASGDAPGGEPIETEATAPDPVVAPVSPPDEPAAVAIDAGVEATATAEVDAGVAPPTPARPTTRPRPRPPTPKAKVAPPPTPTPTPPTPPRPPPSNPLDTRM